MIVAIRVILYVALQNYVWCLIATNPSWKVAKKDYEYSCIKQALAVFTDYIVDREVSVWLQFRTWEISPACVENPKNIN